VRRIFATVALAATVIVGGASAANAAPSVATSRHQSTNVTRCIGALLYSHRTGDDDRATVVCSHITTQYEANQITAWAMRGHRWALDIIG
jgi:hypothetical protein